MIVSRDSSAAASAINIAHTLLPLMTINLFCFGMLSGAAMSSSAPNEMTGTNSLRRWHRPDNDGWHTGTRTRSGAMVISRTATAGTENHQVPLRKTQCLSDAERSLSVAVDDSDDGLVCFMWSRFHR